MAGKTYKQNTRVQNIYFNTTAIKKGFFKEYEVYSSDHAVAYHIDIDNVVELEVEDGGDAIAVAPQATKDGWIFVGWRLDSTPDSNTLPSYIVEDEGIDLYAVFQRDITVSLYGGSTTLTDTGIQYYNVGNLADPSITLSAATRSGWTLVGYRDDRVADPQVSYLAGSSYQFSENTSLFAVFSLVVYLYVTAKGVKRTYPGTRYYNNGNVVNPIIKVADPSALADATFNGYSSSSSSITVVNRTLSTGITITSNTSRFAVWTYHDAVLDTSTYKCYQLGAGSMTVRTLNTTKYVRLEITASCRLTMATWNIQNNATLYIGGGWFATAHYGGPVGSWVDVAVPGTNVWINGSIGECAHIDPQTVTTPSLAASSSFVLKVVTSGEVSPWDDHDTSGATITRIKGIGRTIVY